MRNFNVCFLVLAICTPLCHGFCQDGWTLWQGQCYKWFTWLQTEYKKAGRMCQESNSAVLTINTEAEQDFITSYFSHIANNVWFDVENSEFDNWMPNSTRQGDCGVVHFLSRDEAKWLKTDCFYQNEVICKANQIDFKNYICDFISVMDAEMCRFSSTIIPLTISSTTPSTTLTPQPTTAPPETTTAPPKCESGWHQFGTYCYKVFDAEVKWMDQVYPICNSFASEMVSIHSNEENEFVYNISANVSTGYIWLGAHGLQNHYPFNFTWRDGTDFDYNYFPNGEVPDKEWVSDCIEAPVKPGLDGYPYWRNRNCTGSFINFVCKKKAV